MIKIIQLKSIKPVPVQSWAEIKDEVQDIKDALIAKQFPGKWPDALAVSNCQVEHQETPKNFFVVQEKLAESFHGFTVFCNAIITTESEPVDFKEGCMSYAFRPDIKTKRYLRVTMEADVHNPLKIFGSGLSRRTFHLLGLAAFIAQHEIDHARGVDIYHKFKR